MTDSSLEHIQAVHDGIARVYADTRFAAHQLELRLLVITALWVSDTGARWKEVCRLLDLTPEAFWRLIADDVPRYEPPHDRGGCEVPAQRRSGACGQRGTTGFRITDPSDGTWRLASFCRRHHEAADRAWAQERERQHAGVPEPLPDRGGLLPCYVAGPWERRYARAKPGWVPPAAGVCADDWLARPAVLTVLDGGGARRLAERPLLRVVT